MNFDVILEGPGLRTRNDLLDFGVIYSHSQFSDSEFKKKQLALRTPHLKRCDRATCFKKALAVRLGPCCDVIYVAKQTLKVSFEKEVSLHSMSLRPV